MRFILLLPILFLLAASCASDSSTPVSKRMGNEDDLVARYMKDLIPNATTQNEKDQNIIVDFLIDSLWDFNKTDSGIYYQIEKSKTKLGGGRPGLSSDITAHYRGYYLDGKQFDTSYKKKKPMEFRLNGVIAGWQEVIPMLEKNDKISCIVPSGLAYGEKGRGSILPHSVLRFEIHLIDFEEVDDDELE